MMDKINITKILRDHFLSFKNHSTNKYNIDDFILFILIPILIGVLFQYYKIPFDGSVINVIITSLSVFAALLFNLLILIYDIIRKSEKDPNPRESDRKRQIKAKLLKEIYSNISFSILLCVITLVLAIATFVKIKTLYIEQILTFLISVLVSIFILTLFMVLKRVHILLSNEINGNV